MYYDTTDVEVTYNYIQRPKIYLFSRNLEIKDTFIKNLIKDADEMEDITFKWFYL